MLTGHLDRPLYSSAAAVDAELEAVQAAVDVHHLQVAEARLAQLEARAGEAIRPHHRYQAHALRSHVLGRRGEWAKAGRELLATATCLPTTEWAWEAYD